ncbi:rhamnosyltransferase [Lachnospiraceae bacterium KH1T2]|nr:rhamnosyltransferase [Lachnospiraceae bacterium KH1T2]
MIDVVILTYKPGDYFFKQIKLLEKQTVKPDNIIIMNTEEKYLNNLLYGTAFGERFSNIKFNHLSQREFNHGRTRNMAASKSEADYLIFMTQDAMPNDEDLIKNLLRPHEEDSMVAVSYARQLPNENAGPIEKYNRHFNYPDKDRVKTAEDIKTLGIKTFFCSDVCACYKRSVFEELGGFVDDAVFNEDMIYACSAIKAGYKIYYAASACVVHSHNYNMIQQFKRNFDLGASQADHPEVFGDVSSESEGKKLVFGCINYLVKSGNILLVPKFIFHCAARLMGFKLGKNYKKLSKRVILKLTSNRNYWIRHWDMVEVPDNLSAGYGKNSEGL